MKLALRVKELIDGRGLSIQELASRIDVDEATAERLYQGQSTQIDLTTLGALCEALDVLPHDIVVRVDEPQPSVAGGAPMPRAIDVPTQDTDEISKAQPELKEGSGSDVGEYTPGA